MPLPAVLDGDEGEELQAMANAARALASADAAVRSVTPRVFESRAVNETSANEHQTVIARCPRP